MTGLETSGRDLDSMTGFHERRGQLFGLPLGSPHQGTKLTDDDQKVQGHKGDSLIRLEGLMRALRRR